MTDLNTKPVATANAHGDDHTHRQWGFAVVDDYKLVFLTLDSVVKVGGHAIYWEHPSDVSGIVTTDPENTDPTFRKVTEWVDTEQAM